MYTIEVEYRTGNSFNTEELTECIGLVWEDKELARKALASLKEHYNLYKEGEAFIPKRPADQIEKEAMTKEWWLKSDLSDYKTYHSWWYYCSVRMDNGDWRNLPTGMWCGYFERLHSARVVIASEIGDEDYVTF